MNKISKSKKYRVTGQRQTVLNELRKVYTHPSASSVCTLVQAVDPTISLATVYRSLDFLTKEKLIMKLQTKNKETRYDGNPNAHCHLFCTSCNSVEDIFDISNVVIDSKDLKKSGFQISYDYLEFHGLCNKCIS